MMAISFDEDWRHFYSVMSRNVFEVNLFVNTGVKKAYSLCREQLILHPTSLKLSVRLPCVGRSTGSLCQH